MGRSAAVAGIVDAFWRLTDAPGRSLYADVDRSSAAARLLTRCFYVGLATFALEALARWDHYLGLRAIQPLWPVFWATALPEGRPAAIVLFAFAIGSLGAAFFPDRPIARLGAFVGCLEFHAFLYSFGTVRHVHHLLILACFMFVLLPGGRRADREYRTAYLRAFWGVQAAVLLTYSMSGLSKIAAGAWHLISSRTGVLTPPAMALHVANAGFRFGTGPMLGDAAIRIGAIGLPLYLAIMYIETASLAVAFRPRLHRPWGAILMLLHVGIGLTLNLFFLPSLYIAGVLLLASPFAPERPGWREAVRDLPVLGALVARIVPGFRATLPPFGGPP